VVPVARFPISPAAKSTGWLLNPHRSVVVIDDDVDGVETAVLLLQAAGHMAWGSSHSPSGLDLAINREADVVLLDYLMPVMSGGEVGRALRCHPKMFAVKIIICSATPEAIVRKGFAEYDVFTMKPMDVPAVLRAVASA
jgi:CheY-like chemotaxis protein